ncbi:MAG TPA: prenyltransferase [bacterium]|nr:prenyltransferase [bacterium]HPG81968.1 prenyltransferase [bacterium]HPM60247.1 prenyltransferase [bacterium]
MATLKAYFLATRPWSYTVSVLPPVFGLLIAIIDVAGLQVDWVKFVLTLLGCNLAHSGSNTLSDYFDFKTRVDREGTYGSSGMLVAKVMTPPEMLRWALILYAAAGAIGLYLILTSGNPGLLIALVAAGFILGFFYTMAPFNFKYHALGDVGVFLAFGLLIPLGSYAVQTGLFSWKPLLWCIPAALLVDAILHSNNLRDIPFDSAVHIKTVPILIGERRAQTMYYVLVLGAYALIPLLVISTGLTWLSLLVFLSLPVALQNIRTVRRKQEMAIEQFAGIDAATAKLHLLFGLLFIAALAGRIFFLP